MVKSNEKSHRPSMPGLKDKRWGAKKWNSVGKFARGGPTAQ